MPVIAPTPVPRVLCTDVAAALIAVLRHRHGPLLFHQSGGCCDGSAPMCFVEGEFRVGERDVLLGHIADCPVYVSGPHFEYWAYTQLTIDVVPGRGASFSLEAPEGVRFLSRSRLFSNEEAALLDAAGPPRPYPHPQGKGGNP